MQNDRAHVVWTVPEATVEVKFASIVETSHFKQMGGQAFSTPTFRGMVQRMMESE